MAGQIAHLVIRVVDCMASKVLLDEQLLDDSVIDGSNGPAVVLKELGLGGRDGGRSEGYVEERAAQGIVRLVGECCTSPAARTTQTVALDRQGATTLGSYQWHVMNGNRDKGASEAMSHRVDGRGTTGAETLLLARTCLFMQFISCFLSRMRSIDWGHSNPSTLSSPISSARQTLACSLDCFDTDFLPDPFSD